MKSDESIIADGKPPERKASQKSVEMSFDKYVQLHYGGIDRYIRSYVGAGFRGILKTKEGWEEALSQYTEGNK